MSIEKQNTAIKVRLYPTEDQAELLNKTFGCCRFLWNKMLSDEQEFYSATGEHYIPTPARYKKSAPFLKEVDSQALVTVHQNLRRAFQNFFSKPDKFGYPEFKRKKSGKNAYTVYCQHYKSGNGSNVYLTQNGVRLPKLGTVKAILHRRPLHWWTLKSATVSKSSSGKYYCALLYEYPVKLKGEITPTNDKTLALSFTPSHFYTDSEGTVAEFPPWIESAKQKLTKLQEKLSKMEFNSKNYNKYLQKVYLMQEHIANQRLDYIHKESRRIANAWDCVCVRDENLQEYAQKLGLSKAVQSGFGMLRTCLEYKLRRQGKAFVCVDKYSHTTKTCSVCGHVNYGLDPGVKTWKCPECSTKHNRGVNAAQNIKALGLAKLQYDNNLKSSA